MQTKRNLLTGVMLIVLSLVMVMPAFAQGRSESDADWSFIEFVPCANGGAGEEVDMTGTIHFVEVDGVFHANLQNASGVGQVTGDVYRAIGAVVDMFHWADGAEVWGYVDNFRLIGPGPDNNLLLSFGFHGTLNANGEVAVVISDESVECR
jgi:hypothetical protein